MSKIIATVKKMCSALIHTFVPQTVTESGVKDGVKWVYEGECVNGCWNGKGKMTLDNGCSYEGMFINNEFIEGKYTFHTGDVYEGEFLNGVFNGDGKLTLVNGDIYEGRFADGYFNGKFTVTKPDGTQYTATFKDGEPVE